MADKLRPQSEHPKYGLADPELVRLENLKKRREAAALAERLSAEVERNVHGRSYRNAPKAGRMNKTEAAYAEHLEQMKRAGYVREYKYGSLSLRLADRTWYRPDFFVVANDPASPSVCRFEIREVKGHWEDDARAKFKIAAEQYPVFLFVAVRRDRGEFRVIETLNA